MKRELTKKTYDSVLTMKWSNRIAQGFSPGWADTQDRPESGDRRRCVSSHVTSRSICHAINSIQPGFTCHAVRSPLSGRSYGLPHPGLKPWAILSDHFMVK